MVGACQCGSRGSECVTAILFWPFMVSLLGGGTRTHAHVLALRPTPKAERIELVKIAVVVVDVWVHKSFVAARGRNATAA